MNPYMTGTQQRPADLQWFMDTLAIHHKLSPLGQHLLDQLVLSRGAKQQVSEANDYWEEDIEDLRCENSALENQVSRLTEELDEAESELEEARRVLNEQQDREWHELLDDLKRKSSEPLAARPKECDCCKVIGSYPRVVI